MQGRHFSSGWTQSDRFNLADHKMFFFVDFRPNPQNMAGPKISNHQHRTTGRTIGSIERRPLSHFESEYFTFGKICLNNGPETKKRAIHMNIFVLTFLGRYQYQGFTLILGAVKRN